MRLTPTLVDLYYFYLRAPFSLIKLKLQRKVWSIGKAPAEGFMPFQHFEKLGMLSILLQVAPGDSPYFTSMRQQTLGH